LFVSAKIEKSNSSLVTLTLFGYDSAATKAWAFAQMGVAARDFQRVENLNFWKLLGTGAGGGGFSLRPNFARYGLLGVWKNESSARDFLENSARMKKYRKRAAEIWTVFLLPTKAHGAWSGQNPFEIADAENENAPVAVLTRATIRLSKLKRFWAHVPAASDELVKADGLIRSIGVGEAPFVRQATFSFWQSESAMKNFAYHGAVHREIIKKTRAENWYAEDLFARFQPVASEGVWDGADPLAEFLR
jgi:hypothetical protein